MINIKNFDSNLLKIDKNSYKNIDSYYNGYLTIKHISDYENFHSVNLLHLILDEVDWYTEEKNRNKFLTFASTDKNKKVSIKYTEFWDKFKYLTGNIEDKTSEYRKDFMKIKFNSDDNLPWNKILQLHMLAVIVRYVFQEDNKYYPQFFLNVCMNCKCLNIIEYIFQKELMLTKQMHQKNVIFVIIDIFSYRF